MLISNKKKEVDETSVDRSKFEKRLLNRAIVSSHGSDNKNSEKKLDAF